VCRLQIRRVHNQGVTPTIPPSYFRIRAVLWECRKGQTHTHTDTQTCVTNIHFVSSTIHAKCNNCKIHPSVNAYKSSVKRKTKGGNDHFNRKNSTKTRIDYVIVRTNSQTDKQTDKQTNRHCWKHPPRFAMLCRWVIMQKFATYPKLFVLLAILVSSITHHLSDVTNYTTQ